MPLRAERRLGQMMKEIPKAQPMENQYGAFEVGASETPTSTLASVGIDKNLAKRTRDRAVHDFENGSSLRGEQKDTN
jgi:hypothetical protein